MLLVPNVVFSGFVACALVRNAYSGTNCSKVLSSFCAARHKHSLRPRPGAAPGSGQDDPAQSVHPQALEATWEMGMFLWGCILCARLRQVVGVGVKIGFVLTQVNGETGKGMKALVVNNLHV